MWKLATPPTVVGQNVMPPISPNHIPSSPRVAPAAVGLPKPARSVQVQVQGVEAKSRRRYIRNILAPRVRSPRRFAILAFNADRCNTPFCLLSFVFGSSAAVIRCGGRSPDSVVRAGTEYSTKCKRAELA